MGGIFSKNQFTDDMSCYEVACALDLDLQSFDVTLQERTNRVNSLFAAEVNEPNEPGSISFDAIREIIECLLEIDRDVANFNLKCKEDIWRNQELFSFVEDYFANSLKTLEFCIALENCLKRTRDKQLIIKLAVEHFEEEVKDGVDGVKHVKTLEELRKYKAAGDPFTEEFFVLLKSVYEQHALMWEKLKVRKRELDKKLKSIKTCSRVLNVIFAAASFSVLVLSLVAATIAAPHLVLALAGALTALGSAGVGKWFSSLLTRYEDDLKSQGEVIRAMQVGTRITITDLRNIEALANKLEIEIKSILDIADFALREEDAVKLAIDEIKKKLDVFMKTIHQLSDAADKCGRDIRHARTVVLRTMFSRENI